MKPLFVLAFLAFLGPLAAAQVPAAPGAVTSAAAAAPASARGWPANLGKSSQAYVPEDRWLDAPGQTPTSVHRQHHWLRWAVVSVAVILGVIAAIAYRRNQGKTVNMGLP